MLLIFYHVDDDDDDYENMMLIIMMLVKYVLCRLAESIGLSHRSTLLTSSPTNVKKPGDDENKLRWWTSNRMLTRFVFR